VPEERQLRHVVLVGAMGAGKTTVGRLLAVALRRPFVDNDELLGRATGSTAAAITAADGLDVLHELERDLALRAITDREPKVVAVAASLGSDPRALDRLRAGAWIVWLRADPAVLRARISGSTARPEVGPAIEAQTDARARAYRAAADLVVDTGADRPEDTVRAIEAGLPSPAA
jgi:shikimate kinase